MGRCNDYNYIYIYICILEERVVHVCVCVVKRVVISLQSVESADRVCVLCV